VEVDYVTVNRWMQRYSWLVTVDQPFRVCLF